jgi:hypothetical protein
MSRSRSSDDSGGVQLFPFLAVLLCTMGGLLLLLAVFAEHTKRGALTKWAERFVEQEGPDGRGGPSEAKQIAEQLSEVRRAAEKLEQVRAQAAQVRADEQARLAHAEEHQRRLEHELAKLHLTLRELEAAEEHQQVDREQARREAERLEGLVEETREQVADQQTKATAKRSYAVVPYKGKNGTFRRPIYIECTDTAVTIQPEGIVLKAADFDGPMRSGNPLASAIRAAREELASRPVPEGQERLDPYPLLIIRPSGAAAYSVSVDAIRNWDADFGYEFVESDWQIEYPQPDPRLAQVMAHAVDNARERQALLATVAPRRYGPRLGASGGYGGSSDDGAAGAGGGAGGGFESLTDASGGDRIGANSAEGALAGGSGVGSATGGGASSTSSQGQGRYGEMRGSSGGPGGGGSGAGGDFADQFAGGAAQGGGNSASGAAQSGDATGANASAGQAGASGGSPGGAGAAAASSGAMAGGGGSSAASASSTSATGAAQPGAGATAKEGPYATTVEAMDPRDTIDQGGSALLEYNNKKQRAVNWANAGVKQFSSAITRPIRVVVRTEEMLVYPTDEGDPSAAGGAVVTFHQPTEKVLDELAAAVQVQIADWGLAGSGMYWRPTLVLDVESGAERHAARIAALMENSGLDVKLPERLQTAARPAAETAR